MKQRSAIVGDAWGGFAAMLVALPAAIAYGIATYGTLGPECAAYGIRAGVLGTIVLGIVTALVGGAPRVISAPSAPAAAILASIAALLVAEPGTDPQAAIVLLGLAALLAGVLQMAFGAVGGGRLIKFIPYPVVSGYLSAVAVIILRGQLPACFGARPATSLSDWILTPDLWRSQALAVAVVTISTLLLAPRLTKAIPAAIIGLVAGTVTYLLLAFADPDLRTVTDNPLVLGNVADAAVTSLAGARQMLEALAALRIDDLKTVLVPALTLSVLLSVDALKTCVIVDALTFSRHDSNRTLFGQGLGNAVSALVGGMPGSGTIGATMVNLESGGKSRLSGGAVAVFAFIGILLLGTWIAWIPVSALAAILVVVAVRMFDWGSLNLLRQRSTMLDFLVVATVVLTAVTTNLVAAAGAGVALAMVLFIRDQIRGSVIRRKARGTQMSSKQHRLLAESAVLDRSRDQILVCELQGSLFFGTTDQLWRELEHELKTCRFLILDLRRAVALDYTATQLFTQFATLLHQRDGFLLFSRVPARPELRRYFSAQRAVNDHPNTRIFDTLDDALQWAEDRIVALESPSGPDVEAPLELDEFDLIRELEDSEARAALAHCLKNRSVSAGQCIFRAGDPSDELFLVRSGVVRITLPLNGNDYHTLATFGRGHFFGEMAFLVHGPRSANAVATTDTLLYSISRAEFDRLSAGHPSIGLKFFSHLAHVLAVRLRRADSELRAFYEA